MDSYHNMYKNICRLCLSVNSADKMVSLIDNSNDDGLSCFGKAVTTLTNVIFKKDDKLPTFMCHMCICLLKQTIYFKLKCESTDKQLQRLLKMQVNNESSESNFEEVLCQYVMFNQYFPSTEKSEPSSSDIKPKNGVKSNNFERKNNKNSSHNTIDITIDFSTDSYDFDDFLNQEDNSNHSGGKQEENQHEINNILDTIQNMLSTESNAFLNRRKKRKFKQEYFNHTQMPIEERNLKCKICHKILANRLTYDHHMQRHNHCRYICDQCGKGFPVLTELHMHQVARHGIGPHLKCDHCSYKAPRKINLIEHLRLHTGERPFTCDKCGLTFRRKAIWRNHLVCHKEKTYQCTYCPRKFFRQSSMVAHCNNVHERVYMFMCSVCSVTYAKTQTVRRHMVIKHGIPREKQGRIARIVNGSTDIPGKVN